MNRIELGKYLRSKRNEMNMSIYDMAKEAAVSVPYISNIEKGGIEKPGYDKIEKIALVYNVKKELLLDIYYPKPQPSDKESDMKIQSVLSDSALDTATREMVKHEQLGRYTKNLIIELYDRLSKKPK